MKLRSPKLFILLTCGIVGSFLVPTFLVDLVKLFAIPYSSMSPTIQPGDYILTTRSFRSPADFERNQIVVFDPPTGDPSFIQRIVAMPGDRIEVIDGHLHVNGTLLQSPEGHPSTPGDIRNTSPNLRALFPSYPLTVPGNHAFLLGDNYLNSLDSRYFGPVPLDSVTHTPRFVFLPPSRLGSLD